MVDFSLWDIFRNLLLAARWAVGLSLALLGCLAGAQHVQLWHGISVKRLNLQLIPHLGARGADIRLGHRVSSIAPGTPGWQVDGQAWGLLTLDALAL